MKLFLMAALFAIPLLAQNPGPVFPVTTAPSGTCGANVADLVGPGGALYTCQNGTWAQISGGGGGSVSSVSFTGGIVSVANPTSTPALTVAGTSGGIPYFSSTSAWASSAAGAVGNVMLWGGAGAAPTDGGALPTVTGGTCTNQVVTVISVAAVPSCTTITQAYVDTTIAKTGTDINTSNQVTATHLAAALPGASGGTGSANSGGLATVTGALKANGSGTITQAACADLSNAVSTCSSLASPAFTGAPTAPTQAAGDNTTDIATDAFVTTAVANAVAASNPATSVLAASTASLTGTYANGASGVGATFTVTATGVFTLDGTSISTIGQRVLLKNQSSAFQNGVYTATVVGAVAVSPVFTRASDYNQPSDINSTGAIFVQTGTVNILTSWLLTSTVTTMGTDSLTYSQSSSNPSNLVTAVSPGSGIAHFAGSTQAVTSSAVSLTADVSGTLPLANGGTNGTDAADNGGIIWSNASGYKILAHTATAGQPLVSGNSATPAWSTDLTWASHTWTLGASGILDLSAASTTAGLKIPAAAGAVPTADDFLAFNTTNHTHVWGSNSTTIVGAAAATGTNTATTCSNQFVSAVSGIAIPTCTTVTLAGAQFANQGTTVTVLHGNGSGNPSFASVVSADLNITTTTCSAPQVLTAISATGTGTCTTNPLTQNSQSAAYTTVLGDAGKQIYHPGADTTARTWTIDSNANVAYPVGTILTFINDTSAGVVTIAITTDTLVLAGAGTTGSRTLAASGIAQAVKMTTTRWLINGAGLT